MKYDEEKKVADIVTDMLKRIDELREENRQLEGKIIFLETEMSMTVPIRILQRTDDLLYEKNQHLAEAMTQLNKILSKYVELASSGDCGFWNPEEESDVRECRAFIKRVEEGN